MKFDISGNPSYGDLTIALAAGESVWCEGGAMSRMSSHLELKTRLVGGLVKSVIRRLVGGESLLISQYRAPRMAFVALTPSCPGSVLHRPLDGGSFYLTAGSFLACSPGMQLETRFGGLRAFCPEKEDSCWKCRGRVICFSARTVALSSGRLTANWSSTRGTWWPGSPPCPTRSAAWAV